MKRMQRLGGKMLKRSADESDVGSVIAEFKLTDQRLEQLVKDVQAWKMQWEAVLKYQADASEAFLTLYQPIDSVKNPESRHTPATTPASFMQKCSALAKVNSDLRTDLAQEIAQINNSILKPLETAKLHTKHMHKTLKHRENMKLDYERYLGKAEHARKKENRTVKDEAALVKYESDLAQSQIDYQVADDQVKQTFPPVLDAVISLFPYILAIQISLQTNMVGHFYTVLDAYCRQYGLPSPAPSDSEIVQKWEGEFMSFKQEMESGLQIIARGKALHKPMTLPAEKDKSTLTGLGIRNKVLHRNQDAQPQPIPIRQSSSPRPSQIGYRSPAAIQDVEEEDAPPKPPRPGASPSYGAPSLNNATSRYGSPGNAPYDRQPTALHPHFPSQQPSWGDSNATPPSRYLTPSNGHSPAASSVSVASGDYFATQNRRPSATSLASSAASMAAKKKPPPPVPVKRMPSAQAQYVTALYDFEGQNPGDLPFQEGDRIRVVKKTESTDDWWDGELRGRTGAFPANYVQL